MTSRVTRTRAWRVLSTATWIVCTLYAASLWITL